MDFVIFTFLNILNNMMIIFHIIIYLLLLYVVVIILLVVMSVGGLLILLKIVLLFHLILDCIISPIITSVGVTLLLVAPGPHTHIMYIGVNHSIVSVSVLLF